MMTTFETCAAQLESLLETENAALSRMDVAAVAALTAEKTRLVSLLRDYLSSPSRHPDLADVGPRVRTLSRASEDNKVHLERAMFVQRRLMAIVASAAQPPATGYGRSGAASLDTAVRPRAMIARA